MLKTDNRIEKEAVALYTEHKDLVASVEEKNQYIDKLESMKKLMAHYAVSGESSMAYESSMNLDKAFVVDDINTLEEKLDTNIATSASYLHKNPRLYRVAVKDAQNNGVHLNLQK